VSRIRRRGSGSWTSSPRARIALWIGGVALGAFLLGFLGTAIVFRLGGGATSVASVPDVRHRSEGEARRLASRSGLELEVAAAIAHPTAPSGSVLAQVPLPGHEVQPGTALRVTLSAGRPRLLMPGLVGRRLEQARQVLAALGSEVEVEVEEVPAHAPAGQVIATQPAAGTPVEARTRALLTVSSGPPRVEVPLLIGLEEGDAVTLLAEAGLSAELHVVPGMYYLQPVVVGQRPHAGDSVRVGSAVVVQVATGPP
jgi:eukaryotic-like serine/threonine-protein kinase